MDVEPSTAPKPRRVLGRNPACCHGHRLCCTVCLTLLSLIVLIVLAILSRTFYKAKHPVNTVNSISLLSFDFSLLRLGLNLTLDLDLSIHNPNKVGFKYRNGTAPLNFNGQLIGQVPIPGGEIDARDTNGMNLTLTIFADRLLSDSQAYADALTWSLPAELVDENRW